MVYPDLALQRTNNFLCITQLHNKFVIVALELLNASLHHV